MNRGAAEALVETLSRAGGSNIEKLDPLIIETFHVWAQQKPLLGIFRHVRQGEALHFLIIDWKSRGDDYYLVIFGRPAGAPLLEASKIDDGSLRWSYSPRAQDGRNPERQQRFITNYGSRDVAVSLPTTASSVAGFVNEIWKVVDARRAAEQMTVPEQAIASFTTRAWIFQGNPKYYDLARALESSAEHQWLVNRYGDRIKPGDRVFIWASGKGGGLLAYGRILTSPKLLPARAEDRPFVLDETELEQQDALRVLLHVEHVLEKPLPRDTLRGDPRLAGLGFLRVSQGTNFPLTEEQGAALLDLAEGGRLPRVVKIAPGEQGKFWEECRRGEYICVGWDDVGDLHLYAEKTVFRDEFQRHYPYNGVESAVTKKSNELWTLRELQPGDIVVANRGTSEVLAVGTVTEPGYVWRPQRAEFKHTVTVRWDESFARSIPKQAYWGTVTVTEIPTELYSDIVSGREIQAKAAPAPAVASPFTQLCDAVRDAGLSYSQEVMSAYLLALQAKRFVILTGISGTGKTRLAQTVARELGTGTRAKEMAQVPQGAFEFTVKPYNLQHHRLAIPAALRSAIRLTDDKQVEMRWREGRSRLTVMRTGSTDKHVSISFSGEFREWFQSRFSVGDVFYIELIETEDGAPPTLRIGVPGKEVRQVKEEPRYTVVAVRPDWTDNRGMLGYYNPILQEYVPTECLRLLLRAAAEQQAAAREHRPPEPYFLILDEMNLARVEHYFSDFLSALESGESIELHHDEEVENGEKGDETPVPRKLRIPSNVYFTGTVNVDESTQMFSPKVLDRAFVLELNLVDLRGFAATGVSGEMSERAGLHLVDLPRPLETVRLPAIQDWEQLGTMLEGSLLRAVVGLHGLLEQHNRHFGYRVANEIGRFVALAEEQCANTDAVLWAALDLAVLFKVLPKLHGTQQDLEGLLESLFVFATTLDYEAASEPASSYQAWVLERDTLRPRLPDQPSAALPRTAAKLHRMADRLRRRGFTSFIE
jgi:hypothetical protein